MRLASVEHVIETPSMVVYWLSGAVGPFDGRPLIDQAVFQEVLTEFGAGLLG